jgi:hypothetical protein
MAAIMEEDVTAKYGPKGHHDAERGRGAARHGRRAGSVSWEGAGCRWRGPM